MNRITYILPADYAVCAKPAGFLQLKEEIQTLQQEIEVQERQIENLEQFIQRVRKYEDLDELTPYALRELVKAIYIEAPDKSSGKRH